MVYREVLLYGYMGNGLLIVKSLYQGKSWLKGKPVICVYCYYLMGYSEVLLNGYLWVSDGL